MKTDTRFGELPSKLGQGQAEPDPGGEPPPEAAERFAGLLQVPAAGAAVLASLGGSPPPAASPAARLVEELAQRLLVEEGEGGGGSVRVLAQDVGIPGLEVVVRREAGGLVVELLAPHPADLALLRRGAGELSARLEARFATRAEVRVQRRPDGQG